MEERFFTGYCRALDCPRTVAAEKEDGGWFVDCSYPGCPFADSCPIAKELDTLE